MRVELLFSSAARLGRFDLLEFTDLTLEAVNAFSYFT